MNIINKHITDPLDNASPVMPAGGTPDGGSPSGCRPLIMMKVPLLVDILVLLDLKDHLALKDLKHIMVILVEDLLFQMLLSTQQT